MPPPVFASGADNEYVELIVTGGKCSIFNVWTPFHEFMPRLQADKPAGTTPFSRDRS